MTHDIISTAMGKFKISSYFLFILWIITFPWVFSGCQAIQMQFISESERYRIEADELARNDRNAEAILAYRQAIIHDENNFLALKSLAKLYASQGRGRLALLQANKALKLTPDDSDLLVLEQSLKTLSPSNSQLKLRWQSFVVESPPTGVVADEQQIYATFENGIAAGLELTTGKIIWKVKLASKITSSPVLAQGLLWFGLQDGSILAISHLDGSTQYSFGTTAPIYAPPLVTPELIYCPSSDGVLYALTYPKPAISWAYKTGSALRSSPNLYDGKLYFGSANGRLFALNAQDGTPFWQYGILTQGAVESQPIVFDGRILFGSSDGRVYSLSAQTGGEYWRFSTPDGVFASPLILDNTVYIASIGQTLAAADFLTGDTLWEITTSNALLHKPLIDGQILYYTTTADPHLFAVDIQNGRSLWDLDTGDWIAASPILAQENLVLAGKDGSILVYSR
ncbi:MAG TPA: PQQ-binding-like beta-propeller repeat protein [Anaerolineaceae bacterium]